MAIKGTQHFLKLQYYWSLTTRLLSVISGRLLEDSYSSVEIQSINYAVPAGWTRFGIKYQSRIDSTLNNISKYMYMGEIYDIFKRYTKGGQN